MRDPMAKRIVMPYRRKMEGKTDYKRRLVLLKSSLPRLVIRSSNKSIQAQLVTYEPDGDKVHATARATDLKKLGWTSATGNTSAAYYTGLLLASKLKKNDVKSDIIVDIGLAKHHVGGRIYGLVKGVVDGGFAVRVSSEVFPSEERISGSHLDAKVAKSIAAVKAKLK